MKRSKKDELMSRFGFGNAVRLSPDDPRRGRCKAPQVFKDRKKQANKMACRKKHFEDA